MGIFNFFKKENKKIQIVGIGAFELIEDNYEKRFEGRFHSKIFGVTNISFPVKQEKVSDYQIDILFKIEHNWGEISKELSNDYRVVDIMIPELKSFEFDEIDAEIVVKNNKHIKSIILKNDKIDAIIEIE
uniref:hypothetical protein n=1 Tax=Flavobacterium sp. TaxID=239 RepID=UPI0040491A5C